MLRVLAAGSLRSVWEPLMACFSARSGINVSSQFGPAGLLRQRIEQGEDCDLFASANQAHPAALCRQGLALATLPFAANRLCLTVASNCLTAGENWLSLLMNPALRLATSTPVSDPSGDYTWQLFDTLDQRHPCLGATLRQRALPLVGGPHSPAVPSGELAASWLIRSGQAEMFIGYASYAEKLRRQPDLAVLPIPDDYNVAACYALAQCTVQAKPLADFLLSPAAQSILVAAGFGGAKLGC